MQRNEAYFSELDRAEALRSSGTSTIEPFGWRKSTLVLQGQRPKHRDEYLVESEFVINVTGPIETHEEQIRVSEYEIPNVRYVFHRGPYQWFSNDGDVTRTYYAYVAFV